LALKYSTPAAFAGRFATSTQEELSSIEVEAKALRDRVDARTQHVRDKAKALLGTTSFIASVTLGAASFLAAHPGLLPTWSLGPILALLLLMLLQFGYSLIRAMSAITREQVVDISTDDILTLNTGKVHLITAQLAAANAYQVASTEQVNKLILG